MCAKPTPKTPTPESLASELVTMLQRRFKGLTITSHPVLHAKNGIVQGLQVNGVGINAGFVPEELYAETMNYLADQRSPNTPRPTLTSRYLGHGHGFIPGGDQPGPRSVVSATESTPLQLVAERLAAAISQAVSRLPVDSRYGVLANNMRRAMVGQLVKNAAKGHWGNDPILGLLDHLDEEVKELRAAAHKVENLRSAVERTERENAQHQTPNLQSSRFRLEGFQRELLGEAADVANIAAMVADLAGGFEFLSDAHK